ncbi:MAG: CARDB domain-containing protein, partial [Thermoplasmata archaeon]|nr:CARDB domain-containing protein [Thermoplasmata archaeon]
MRRGFLPVLALLLLVLPAMPGQAQDAVAVFITGPDNLGTGETAEMTATIAGGPGENDGTWSINAWLEGPDLTGAAPLEDNPLFESSGNSTFTFNVTMPQTDQFVTLVVEGNSTKAGDFALGTSRKQIRVLVPLDVTATVRNTGAIEVRNVPAFLFINEQQVQETEIDAILPGESKVVRFSYLPVDLGVGTHTLEVRVDLDRNGIIDP